MLSRPLQPAQAGFAAALGAAPRVCYELEEERW